MNRDNSLGDLNVTIVSAAHKTRLESELGAKDGNWIELVVLVKNDGKKQQTIDSSQLSLVGPDGAKCETDGDSINYVNTDEWLFSQKINPGLSKQSKVCFAVPKSVTSGTVVFQEGAFGLGKKAEFQISVK